MRIRRKKNTSHKKNARTKPTKTIIKLQKFIVLAQNQKDLITAEKY